MSHARAQIRTAVKTILSAGNNTWAMVVASRVQPLRQVWPFLLVYSDGEADQQVTTNYPVVYEREMSLTVVGMLRVTGSGDVGAETVEDLIDTLCAEIETKLTSAALRTALPMVNLRAHLTNTTVTVVVDETDKIDHAEVTLTWSITYFTNEGAPETLI